MPAPAATFEQPWVVGLPSRETEPSAVEQGPPELPPATAELPPAGPAILDTAAERPYERPSWFETDEDVLAWAPDETLVEPPPAPSPSVEPAYTPHPAKLSPTLRAPPPLLPPLLPPGQQPRVAQPTEDTPGEAGWDAPRRRPGFVPAQVAGRPGRRRSWAIAAAVILIPVVGAGLMLGTRLLGGPARPAGQSAVFNAPIMVLRAAASGRIESVAVANGQSVEPGTVLLTIHAEQPPDPAMIVLRNRLAAATGRAASLDAALAGPAPTTDAGRAKLADTKRLRAAAGAEIDQLQAGLAAVSAPAAADTAVKAGLHGKVWSVEATTGTTTAAGAPLVRLLDCDHPFLTLANAGPLQAGQTVEVRMPGLPPTSGTVRLASGIAEPTGSLVIEPAKIAGPNGCPVGLAATVIPTSGLRS